MASHDMHNHWNKKVTPVTDIDVVLNVSFEEISIVVDDKIIFKQTGGVSKNDAQLIRFIAEGLAGKFNSVLRVNEIREILN